MSKILACFCYAHRKFILHLQFACAKLPCISSLNILNVSGYTWRCTDGWSPLAHLVLTGGQHVYSCARMLRTAYKILLPIFSARQ
ncbi:hypothetical protein [Herminiimonas arsenitoxidans]|uniref:hypothetical protein n=1 Tax=Herminiimonas arsenitoxidans TaxID=1809410 RepID=UPI000971058B|nr:hypothetical protein [Herminiimonas arsenitoxidans]